MARLFSLIGFALAAFAALERLSWDESGFAYTSIIGRTARYGFEEIRWVETTHPYGRRYEPLAYKIHLTGRSIRFEDLNGKLKGFLQTYSAWLRKRSLEPWQKTAKGNGWPCTARTDLSVKSWTALSVP